MASRTISILVTMKNARWTAEVWGEDRTDLPHSDPKATVWDAISDLAQKVKKHLQKGETDNEVSRLSW